MGDEEGNELATGGIVGPQTWRLIGRRSDDVPESYIPQSSTIHSVALLLKTARARFGGENETA